MVEREFIYLFIYPLLLLHYLSIIELKALALL